MLKKHFFIIKMAWYFSGDFDEYTAQKSNIYLKYKSFVTVLKSLLSVFIKFNVSFLNKCIIVIFLNLTDPNIWMVSYFVFVANLHSKTILNCINGCHSKFYCA